MQLLIKCYLVTGEYKKAEDMATDLINNHGLRLMTEPFGTNVPSGNPDTWPVTRNVLWDLHRGVNITSADNKETIMPIVLACMDMARGKVGALIVIERAIRLDDIVDTGDRIDANINQRLIENIFFKNSPLHDGAMVIADKRIKAAGCILPVSHSHSIPKELGLRHRAALGISQDSDAIAIVCSEETGRISVAIKGEFKLRLSAEELESLLAREMKS